MKALFVELPAFAKYRADYLDDEGFRGLQQSLLKNPEAGEVIEGAGGLRKDRRRDGERPVIVPCGGRKRTRVNLRFRLG